MLAALSAAALAASSRDIIPVSPREMAAAVTSHTGKLVLASDIRGVSCRRIEEEGTEATCMWEQRLGKHWRPYSVYVAGARGGIQLIDDPYPRDRR